METGNQFASETNLSIIISSDNSSAVPLTAGGAVQELQSALQSISNQAGLQCAERLFPKLFYTSSVEEATQVIDSYEMKTNSKFIVYKESKFFGQNEPLHVMACQKRGLDGAKNKVVHRIVWEDRETSLAQYEPIPYDGVPYMQLGRKIYDCHLGVLREKPKRNSSKRPRKPQKSRKVGCTARISLREIHKFPEFQIVKGQESDYYRSLKSKEIRRAILKQKTIGERRIYVSLPSISDHSGHDLTRVDNFLTDARVKKKIYELTYQKIFSIKELREKTKEYVEKELFQAKSLPSATDTRFYPSDMTFKNISYLAKLKMRKEGIPVPTTNQRRRTRKHLLPNVTTVPYVAQEVTVEASPPPSPAISEASEAPTDFFSALDEVRTLAIKVTDEALLEELKQNLLQIRERLKNEDCNKQQRLEQDTGELDTWTENQQDVTEIFR